MNYNKSSTKKQIKKTDATSTKVKNKVLFTSLKTILILVLVLIVIGGAAALGIAKGIIDSAPDISLEDVVPTGHYSTVYYDDGKEEITKLTGAGANRESVKIKDIPLHLQQAFIAIEDSRFYEHNGIDSKGIVRAFVVGISKGRFSEGASTITQQLIKNNVLTTWTGESTFVEKLTRKIQEQYLAVKLEQQVQEEGKDKDWILENYLNTINLGSNTLGVQSASEKYFGKDVSELTLSESAVIAGITKNPYGYNPIRFPEKNAERREKVLNDMLEQGYITQRQYGEAMADNVYERIASYNVETPASVNSYFVDALIDDVLNDLIEKGYTETEAYNAIYRGGLSIHSTQNKDMQTIAEEEVENESNYPMKPQYSFNLSFQVKKADGTIKNYSHQTMLSHYKKVKNDDDFTINYASEEKCYEAIEKYKQDVLAEGGTIVEGSESVYITLQPQVALTVIDQSTGEVKALIGGRGDKEGNRTWNRATDTIRQPGSTFKIIGCFAAALDTDEFTLASVQEDAEFSVGGKTFKNADRKYHGLTTIRTAITKSYNIPTVKTLQDLGISTGYDYALDFGFTTLSDSDRNLSLALGGLTKGVNNLELTASYAAIANNGEYIEPSFYTTVYDHDGNILLDNTQTKEHHTVIKETTAWLLTDAMKDVMTSGTGTRAYFGSSMAQAGKSGTTTDVRDSLFAGYTPYYTCAIWGGYDDNSKNVNSNYTKNIYREVMERIHNGLAYKDFTRPSGITNVAICTKSGLKATEACSLAEGGSTVYSEYFTTATVPTATCSTHITLNICQETGKVASANCPLESVVQKVFLYGGSSTNSDNTYIATDEFINTICEHVPEIPEITDPTLPPDGSDSDTSTNNNQDGNNEQPGDNSGTVTPPSNNNNSGGTTPPPSNNNNSGDTTTPPSNNNNSGGTTTPPSNNNSGDNTTPSDNNNSGGNTTPSDNSSDTNTTSSDNPTGISEDIPQ